VQLDKTRIVIRERGLFDTFDLALQVLRTHALPLTATLGLGAFPLASLNYFLIGWMVNIDPYAPLSPDQFGNLIRYIWTMVVLVSIEAPFASAFATTFLGQALFLERPSLGHVCRQVLELLPRLVWMHALLRGVLPVLILVAMVDRESPFSAAETMLILLFVGLWFRRATAPFMNEIILLERNPIRSTRHTEMTIRRRSRMLHGPVGGSLIYLGFMSSLLAFLMTGVIFGSIVSLRGVLMDDWSVKNSLFLVGLPAAMWLAVEYLTVVRFLAYLDLRIRYEGWEVELHMRAEGKRLMGGPL
jgi:hypothetical protein